MAREARKTFSRYGSILSQKKEEYKMIKLDNEDERKLIIKERIIAES